MSDATFTAECIICKSIIDIRPVIDPNSYDKLQSGEGIFFVCGLCKEKLAQVFKCPGCQVLNVLDFTEIDARYAPNSCAFCGKVEIYSMVELLPMIEINRRYL